MKLCLVVLPILFISCAAAFDYVDFKPDDATQTCTHDLHANPFNKQVRGVNLGGWLVLEPWLTPSLFYQFLGTQKRFGDKAPEKTGMDTYSFCRALGADEANKQLRVHWKNWVTEDDMKKLASFGINSVRIPVGDWIFKPYGPYINCTDGALDELDRVLDLAHQYNIDALLDIHGHRGSQNGFDNSGMAHVVSWTSLASTLPIGTTTFSHWPHRVAEWVGTFDPVTKNYSSINYDNIQHSLDALLEMTVRYQEHPAVLGVQPINEPWELTPIDTLKDFYWKGYLQTKRLAPRWKYVLHDSFRFGVQFWSGFMKGCPDVALDTHIYQAWNNPGTHEDFFSNACQQRYTISAMEQSMMPVIVGEWSLATDNCAMWLNGFNDNLPGFPKVPCSYIPCGQDNGYLGSEFTGLSLDRTKPIQGPYGTGTSGPSFGQCPVSSKTMFDLSDDEMFRKLALKKLNAFNIGHGWYFWNFKTELDSKWNFIQAVENGWIPRNVSYPGDVVEQACVDEDAGDLVCRAKRGVHEYELKSGYQFACGQIGVNCTQINATYPTLIERCDHAFNQYWHLNRVKGATCDFGGAGQLQTPTTPMPAITAAAAAGTDPTSVPAATPVALSTTAPAPAAMPDPKPEAVGASPGGVSKDDGPESSSDHSSVSWLSVLVLSLAVIASVWYYYKRKTRTQYSAV